MHKQADGLQGMPHDVFRLGVGFRLLMQQLDSRHLLAALGNLDAVPDQDQPAVDTHRTWEKPQHHLRPQSRKPIELDASAVKMGEQPVVELGPQIERTHDAGHTQRVRAHRYAGHDSGEPHEGAQTRECWAQRLDCDPPGAPQRQRPSPIQHRPDPRLRWSGALARDQRFIIR
jgi:hypothetical protein